MHPWTGRTMAPVAVWLEMVNEVEPPERLQTRSKFKL
jgi:hypothetical protein